MTLRRTKSTVLLSLFALLLGASSCASCESCGGKKSGADATAETGAEEAPTAPEATTAPPSTTTAPVATTPTEPNFACRTLARALTTKACACPQKNNSGCCYFGIPPAVKDAPAPYLDCSRGKTDWPAEVEARACKVGMDEKKTALLMSCFAAKDRLICGRTPGGDLGAQVPKECEAFLKEVTQAAK